MIIQILSVGESKNPYLKEGVSDFIQRLKHYCRLEIRTVKEEKILKNQCFQVGSYVIATIKYLNCTNFEGIKIIVLENYELHWLDGLELLDPHFSEESDIVARFVPTEHGMWLAKKFCKEIVDQLYEELSNIISIKIIFG